MDDANLEVAIPSVLFAAAGGWTCECPSSFCLRDIISFVSIMMNWIAGTAGQRCTTLRRLVLHEKIYDEFVKKLVIGYSKVKRMPYIVCVMSCIALSVSLLPARRSSQATLWRLGPCSDPSTTPVRWRSIWRAWRRSRSRGARWERAEVWN